jgi:integrase
MEEIESPEWQEVLAQAKMPARLKPSGLRLMELLRLRVKDLDLEQEIITVPREGMRAAIRRRCRSLWGEKRKIGKSV